MYIDLDEEQDNPPIFAPRYYIDITPIEVTASNSIRVKKKILIPKKGLYKNCIKTNLAEGRYEVRYFSYVPGPNKRQRERLIKTETWNVRLLNIELKSYPLLKSKNSYDPLPRECFFIERVICEGKEYDFTLYEDYFPLNELKEKFSKEIGLGWQDRPPTNSKVEVIYIQPLGVEIVEAGYGGLSFSTFS